MNRLKKQLFSSVFGLFLIAYAGICSAFIVDTNSASGSLSGIWSNPNEGGWGVSVTHQYGKMFVALYVYDNSGAPVWYSASDCSVAASGCTGSLYKVTGGTAPTAPWSATNLVLGSVGSLELKFSDVNTGSLAFTINGASATKNIARYVFASAPPATGGGALTFAKLLNCPNTNSSTSEQFWACFSGTIVGTETSQTYPCTMTIGNGNITLQIPSDNNTQASITPSSPSYRKTAAISSTYYGLNGDFTEGSALTDSSRFFMAGLVGIINNESVNLITIAIMTNTWNATKTKITSKTTSCTFK